MLYILRTYTYICKLHVHWNCNVIKISMYGQRLIAQYVVLEINRVNQTKRYKYKIRLAKSPMWMSEKKIEIILIRIHFLFIINTIESTKSVYTYIVYVHFYIMNNDNFFISALFCTRIDVIICLPWFLSA